MEIKEFSCLRGDGPILVLVKDREGLFERGQLIGGQRFQNLPPISLTERRHLD